MDSTMILGYNPKLRKLTLRNSKNVFQKLFLTLKKYFF